MLLVSSFLPVAVELPGFGTFAIFAKEFKLPEVHAQVLTVHLANARDGATTLQFTFVVGVSQPRKLLGARFIGTGEHSA